MKNGRRSFLKGVATGGASLLLGGFPLLQRLAFAQAPSYKGVTYLTPAYRDSMPAISGFVARLALPAAPFRVEFFDSGSLMKADEQVTGLKTGAIQFMFHTTSYMTEQYPILSLPGMPGICDKLYTHGARLAMGSPLWTLINQVLDRDGLFMLTAGGGVIEPEYIWSGAKRVASLKDIAGKKCRVMSHEAQEIISSLGGRPHRR